MKVIRSKDGKCPFRRKVSLEVLDREFPRRTCLELRAVVVCAHTSDLLPRDIAQKFLRRLIADVGIG